MTDYENFIALMDKFGVGYKVETLQASPIRYLVSMRHGDRKVGGYEGYGVEFNFNIDGSFQVMGAYDTNFGSKEYTEANYTREEIDK